MASRSLLCVALLSAVIASPLELGDRDCGWDCGHHSPVLDACADFNRDKISLREVGGRNTLDWRLWLELDGKPISFWHDVPLYPNISENQVVNFVVEIPRWVDGKIEIHREEPLNPIFHDDRDDQPRFVESIWPHKSYPFLYGSIPQTWESPNLNHSFTGFPGDNDPMDLFDIGQDPGYTGQIKQVKVLGGLAVNDGDETDWKMLGIDVNDPLAAYVESYKDVEKYRPGTIEAFREWFTYYKVARGDDIIPIVGETYQNVSFSISKIEESHEFWEDLVRGKVDTNNINYNQTSMANLESYVNCRYATKAFDLPKRSNVKEAVEKPEEYEHWYYLNDGKELIEIPEASMERGEQRLS